MSFVQACFPLALLGFRQGVLGLLLVASSFTAAAVNCNADPDTEVEGLDKRTLAALRVVSDRVAAGDLEGALEASRKVPMRNNEARAVVVGYESALLLKLGRPQEALEVLNVPWSSAELSRSSELALAINEAKALVATQAPGKAAEVLAPWSLPGCTARRDQVMFLLADAYSRARRNTAAISVIEQRSRELERPVPKWQMLDLQVRCDAEQYRACAERLLALVESGSLKPGWPELLTEYAAGLAELPETREMLLQAQAQGQFTSAWVPSPKPFQVIRDAETIYRVAPDYPYRASALRLSGWVLAELDVNFEGEVRSVRVLEADPEGEFEQAAERALLKWRFAPRTVNGVAESFTTQVKLSFRLIE